MKARSEKSYPVVTLMATHGSDDLIQINDFVNEQGYWGRGKKLAAARLLRYRSHIFSEKVVYLF